MDAQANQSLALAQGSDLTVDMFSERGFQLAQRVGRAFATSDAVPTPFRSQVLKKVRDANNNWVEEWVENPAALGNCLIAIETARAVRMSITAVMQNANIIENRLSWSGKFVIAAINASGRFTPLRFQVRNLGFIKATYREKKGWNNQKRGYDFEDVEVEVENLECIAWALPAGLRVAPTIGTLVQAREAGLPVIESAPVSMKLAVEEGWYGKAGSKWQTEMKHLMLQYRAGSFFGNIHAPDIVMGMGRTSEELVDMTTVIDLDTGEISTQDFSGKPEVRMPTAKAEVVTEAAATAAAAPAAQQEAASGDAAAAKDEPAAVDQQAAGPTTAQATEQATDRPVEKVRGTLATAGERLMVKNRCKNNGIDLAELLKKHGAESLEAMTTDQFIAIKDDLPKAS